MTHEMTSKTAPIDDTRYFSSTLLERYTLHSQEDLISFASDVTGQCCSQASDVPPKKLHLGSLYSGELGPQVYGRLQWAMRRNTPPQEKKKYLDLAKMAAEQSLEHAQASTSEKQRVSLLESKWVGSMVMLIAIEQEIEIRDELCENLLRELTSRCKNLADQECEILYGRAGAMQSILWLRSEMQLSTLGKSFCLDIAEHILRMGMRNASAAPHLRLPLVWYWLGEIYLGAAHGIVGILQILLQLESEEWNELERRIPNGLRIIEQTIDDLHRFYCFHGSGNLMSSVERNKKDRLVHWCHGAPGWILLLIRASQVFSKPSYLGVAKKTAERTLWPRGLLKKKGLGLCHGIAGNGFVFLNLSHALEGEEQRLWYRRALLYAAFGMAHYDALKDIPDRPLSLYEGLSGFACFLLACADHDDPRSSRFPLYAF
ncbi:MAG: hypothetical protein SGBAC_011518 [Bacillariaceae sp.]